MSYRRGKCLLKNNLHFYNLSLRPRLVTHNQLHCPLMATGETQTEPTGDRHFRFVRYTVLMNDNIGRKSRATDEKQCSLSFYRSLGETGNNICRLTPVMSAAGAWRVWRGARSFREIYSQGCSRISRAAVQNI